MWSERDPRVPPHRRIDADGHPTVADFEEAIRTNKPSSVGLLAVERKGVSDAIGYCGLVDSGHGAQEPELAFEFLRRFWGQGYATEASWAVLDWARSSGYERLWASVWDWNTASRRVLAKVGFTETDREEAIRDQPGHYETALTRVRSWASWRFTLRGHIHVIRGVLGHDATPSVRPSRSRRRGRRGGVGPWFRRRRVGLAGWVGTRCWSGGGCGRGRPQRRRCSGSG